MLISGPKLPLTFPSAPPGSKVTFRGIGPPVPPRKLAMPVACWNPASPSPTPVDLFTTPAAYKNVSVTLLIASLLYTAFVNASESA